MPRTNSQRSMEDTFQVLDAIEEDFFRTYIELGSLKRTMDWVAEQPAGRSMSRETMYAWLKHKDDRWQRWDAARELRGHLSHDEALDEADRASQQDANAQRLKYEAKKWSAMVQNRAVYGKGPEVSIALGVGDEWLHALEKAGEPQLLSAETNNQEDDDPDYEVVGEGDEE